MENSEYKNQSEVPLLGYWNELFLEDYGLEAPEDIVDYLKYRIITCYMIHDDEVPKYLDAAQNGDSHSMLVLADYYYFGKKDLIKSEEWAIKSTLKKNGEAHLFLANLYLQNESMNKSRFEVIYHYTYASVLGYGVASLILSLLYKKGYYKRKRMEYAHFFYLNRAIVQHINTIYIQLHNYELGPCYRMLSECYSKGIGCKPNQYLCTYWQYVADKYESKENVKLSCFMDERFNHDDLCSKAFALWDAEHYYLSLSYLYKAHERGRIAATAILGKLYYCVPIVIYLFETYFTENLEKDDIDLHTIGYNFGFASLNKWPDMEEFKSKGLIYLKKAADDGDISAKITLQRIEEKDVTLSYMTSPFQP